MSLPRILSLRCLLSVSLVFVLVAGLPACKRNQAGQMPAVGGEAIRAQREANTRAAETEAASKRATADAERAAERRQAEEAAAARARQAAEDRARYDERIRKYEAEQAQKK